MCDPVTLTVATIAQTGLSYMEGRAAAQAQEQANEQSRELILENQNLQIQSIKNRAEEDRTAATNDLLSNRRMQLEKQATARVSAGESGISGLSVDALLGDIDRQAGQNESTINRNLDFTSRQRALEVQGIGITAASQVNQLKPAVYPSLFGTVAEAGFRVAQIDGIGEVFNPTYSNPPIQVGGVTTTIPRTKPTQEF